jgi:hypothetical protein
MTTNVKFLSHEIMRHMHILGSRFTGVNSCTLRHVMITSKYAQSF